MNKKRFLVICIICFIVMLPFITYTKEPNNSLQRVKESGRLTVAGSGGYQPFNYIKDGQVVGFDVDVGKEIAKRMGVELNYVVYDWDKLLEGLQKKRYDAIIASMAITDKRSRIVDFTDPYYYSGAQLFVLKDSDIYSASQIAGKVIGVTIGTTFVQDGEKLGAETKYYADDEKAFKDLLNGRIDGVITDRLVGLSIMEEMENGNKIAIVDRLLRPENMGIAINKDDTQLLNRINEILKDMRDDGTLQNISLQWFHGVDITKK